MKRAIAYKRADEIFLHASSMTTAGVWIISLPVLTCNLNDRARLSGYIAEALEGSKEGVSHPTSWKGLFDPVLELAGVKSWSAFAKPAKCVQIELESDQVRFTPTKNLGPKEGFQPIPRKTSVGLN